MVRGGVGTEPFPSGSFKRKVTPIRQRVEALLPRGAFSGNPRLVGMCAEIHNNRQWLWTFVEAEGSSSFRPGARPGAEPKA